MLFTDVCNLFDHLEVLETKQPPLLPADKGDRVRCTVQAWFKARRYALDHFDDDNAVALLSTLLPERRTDRVYSLQAASLARVLSRSLNLGHAQMLSLQAYKERGRGDLGQCLQRVIETTGPPALPKVTLLEVENLMCWLGSQCRFSAPAMQAPVLSSSEHRDERIGQIIKRLGGSDAKWFVRLILKNLAPASLDERLVLRSMHFLLPDLLRFQQNLTAAVHTLKTTLSAYPSSPDPASERLLKLNASSVLRPRTGVKIGRPNFTKARSIQHCLNMLGKASWVIERKYDGEYCEVHIDLSLSQDPSQCIKIFSKSGKDSTNDRRGIIPTLVCCLRLGQASCAIKKEAVLLGELVVWSDETGNVLPFEEIRKHVTRSGSFLGTKGDIWPKQQEHLCIAFFDILLLDEASVLKQSVEARRQILKMVYTKIPGRAKSTEWKVIDFSLEDTAKRRLMEQFAASNAMACEGLVLKPCGVPYFSLVPDDEKYNHGMIKLKKDYIAGLGDEADFAIVGGSYVAQEAAKSGIPNIRWTHFHLGAMLNKEQVERFQQKPVYRLVGTIAQDMCIPKPVLEAANRLGQFCAVDYTSALSISELDIVSGSPFEIQTVFRQPLVFEVLGSGFVKPPDCDFYMLRHARVKKLHQDRTWKDCVSFAELQEKAIQARTTGIGSESQANRHHLERLERTMRKKFERQLTKTPSPAKRDLHSIASAESRSSTHSVLCEVSSNVRTGLRVPNGPKRSHEDLENTGPRCKRIRLGQSAIDAARHVRRQRSCLSSSPMETTVLLRSSAGQHKTVGPDVSELRRSCVTNGCAFSKAVLYFAACVAQTPYVTADLADCHAAEKVDSWKHWFREEREHDSCASTIGESQAYPGLRRIIIAEGRRKQALLALVQDMASSGSSCKCRIEVWDWRVLEQARQHMTALEDAGQFYLGAVSWSERHGRMLYEVNDFDT